MWRLHVEEVPLFVLEGGCTGMSCGYILGPVCDVPREGVKVRCAGSRERESGGGRLGGGDVACVYVLHYGGSIRVGVAGIRAAVGKMLSHVPFMGVVAALIELESGAEPGSIVRLAVEEAGKMGLELKPGRPGLAELVELWRSPPRSLLVQLEQAEEREDPMVVDGVKEAVEAAVSAAEAYGDLLYEPAIHWFTTDRRIDWVPPPLPRAPREGEEVVLKPLPNGMLTLAAREGVWSCTFWELRDALFEPLIQRAA